MPKLPGIRPARKGFLIAIEGIDGTGKTTLVQALCESLRERGISALASREPTDGSYGSQLREIARSGRQGVSAQSEAALFIADREEHVRNVILPALGEGRVVILDRYFYSTVAYQGARGLGIDWLLDRNREFAPEPDLLVILELEVPRAIERISESRGTPPDHFEGADYLRLVKSIFDQIENPNMLRLDASKSTGILIDRILESPQAERLKRMALPFPG